MNSAAEHERWQRRQAVHIVSQLVENHDDAIAILGFARELVEGFLAGGGEAPRREGGTVLQLLK